MGMFTAVASLNLILSTLSSCGEVGGREELHEGEFLPLLKIFYQKIFFLRLRLNASMLCPSCKHYIEYIDVRFRFCIKCGNPNLITLLSEPIIQF